MGRMIELNAIPDGINPSDRKRRERLAFLPEAIVAVREVRSPVDAGVTTKILFRGDTYEHHAVYTDLGYDAVLKLIGWKT